MDEPEDLEEHEEPNPIQDDVESDKAAMAAAGSSFSCSDGCHSHGFHVTLSAVEAFASSTPNQSSDQGSS